MRHSNPRNWRPPVRLALSIWLFAAIQGAAAADTPAAKQGELRQIERALGDAESKDRALNARADELDEELEALRRTLVSAAAALQQRESDLTALEAGFEDLDAIYHVRSAAWHDQEAELARILAALMRLERNRPGVLAAMPGAWTDTARGAALLTASVPALHARSAALMAELETLEALRAEREQKQMAVQTATSALNADRAAMEQLLRRKSSLQALIHADRRALTTRMAMLRNDAIDLRDLIARLEADAAERRAQARRDQARREAEVAAARAAAVARAAEAAKATAAAEAQANRQRSARTTAPSKPAVAARKETAALVTPPADKPAETGSSLPLPAFGTIVRQFGAPIEGGGLSPGVVIRTRAGAQVVAPRDAVVAFAGAFRSYGQLLILEYGEGYHILLAGFAQIDSEVGRHVRAGEPVGHMARRPDATPSLYVEIRHKGQSINPIAWLTKGVRKVSG